MRPGHDRADGLTQHEADHLVRDRLLDDQGDLLRVAGRQHVERQGVDVLDILPTRCKPREFLERRLQHRKNAFLVPVADGMEIQAQGGVIQLHRQHPSGHGFDGCLSCIRLCRFCKRGHRACPPRAFRATSRPSPRWRPGS